MIRQLLSMSLSDLLQSIKQFKIHGNAPRKRNQWTLYR